MSSEIVPYPLASWASLSQAQRDAAFDNTAAVNNMREIQDARHRASAQFREANPAALDIPYAPHRRAKWDLFPGSDSDAPCLVFIHGGYWQRGGRDSASTVAKGVAAYGWSAAFAGYPLAPDVTMGGIVSHLQMAFDWLAEHGRKYGIGRKLIVTGSSAGGHLAAMMLGHSAVHAGLAISGMFDLRQIRDTYLNEKLQLSEEEVRNFSPRLLPVVAKPLSVAYGSDELPALVRNSVAFHAYRRAVDGEGDLILVPGANHFSILDELEKPDGLLTGEILRLSR